MYRYSDFFKTLHDEDRPVGCIGQGTHHSVLRAVVWHDCWQYPSACAKYLDFAIMWDEDHDTRVIEVIELLYFAGLLTPALLVGERKGSFSLVVSDETREGFSEERWSKYQKAVEEITESTNDPWAAYVETAAGWQHTLIHDHTKNAYQYLDTIGQLWELGIKPIDPPDWWGEDDP